jgi:hypothetical protein
MIEGATYELVLDCNILYIQRSATQENLHKRCMKYRSSTYELLEIKSCQFYTTSRLQLSQLLQQHLNAEEYKGSNGCHYRVLPLCKCGKRS